MNAQNYANLKYVRIENLSQQQLLQVFLHVYIFVFLLFCCRLNYL